jgi:hypothetical protein
MITPRTSSLLDCSFWSMSSANSCKALLWKSSDLSSLLIPYIQDAH